MEISYTHILPPGPERNSEEHYCKGWRFADDALKRHGMEACLRMRKNMQVNSSYDRGASDRFDNKPHKYGKAGA